MIEVIKKYLKSNVIKNSLWLILDKALRLLCGLFIGSWVARYLGAEQYGLMSFAVSYAAVFISFSMLGIDNLVIRDLAKSKIDNDKILGTAIRIRNIGSIFTAIFSCLAAYLFYHDNNKFLLLVMILMIGNVFQSFDVLSLWYQAKVESKIIVINKLIAYSFIQVCRIVAIYMKAEILCFVILSVAEYLIGIVLLMRWAVVKDKINIIKWKFSLGLAKSYLFEGWKLAISNFSIIIFMKIDQIFLGTMLGNKAVGIYSVAALISDILYSIPIFIAASTFPKFVQLYENEEESYRKYVLKIFLLMVVYSYISIAGIWLLIDDFIKILYGNEYILAADIAKIHSITLLFVAIGCIRGNMLIIEHKITVLSIITIFGSVLNIILNYFLIPVFDIFGAAIAVLISQMIVCYVSGIFYKDLHWIFKCQTKAILLYPCIRYLMKK